MGSMFFFLRLAYVVLYVYFLFLLDFSSDALNAMLTFDPSPAPSPHSSGPPLKG